MTALYTFGVHAAEVVRGIESGEITEPDIGMYTEEIDVRADSPAEAKRLAQAEVDDLYGEGSQIFPMQPGGSGGLFQVWSS